VVILDATLLGTVNPTEGLKEDGFVVINSNKSGEELRKLFPSCNIAFVDATKIAKEELGVPITNTTMLGSLLKVISMVTIESLEEPTRERFGVIGQKNINAYMRAFNETTVLRPVNG
jgi:pyruvate ferredoxin oxidoreductase gamma subunit